MEDAAFRERRSWKMPHAAHFTPHAARRKRHEIVQYKLLWLLTLILPFDELSLVICVVCDIGICSQMLSILQAY